MKIIKIILIPIFVCLVLTACTSKVSILNQEASILNDNLFLTNPLEQEVITSSIQPKQNTMSTLYGNKIAAAHARRLKGVNFPDNATLYQVTWQQKNDSVWFGAKIPGILKSVEVIKFNNVSGKLASITYTCYSGSPLHQVTNTENKNKRITYILNQRIALTP